MQIHTSEGLKSCTRNSHQILLQFIFQDIICCLVTVTNNSNTKQYSLALLGHFLNTPSELYVLQLNNSILLVNARIL